MDFRIRFALAVAALSAVGCRPGCDDRTTGIIPAPQQVEWGSGTFRMPARPGYAADLSPADSADLAAWCARAVQAGLAPAGLCAAAADDCAPLRLRLVEGGEAESYRLAVTPDSVVVRASDPAGLFYGLQSFCQLADRFGDRIPVLAIEDRPRFGYRGFMLDVSRHFRDKEFVKRQLDLLARYKFNRFHWHLTDGAGWRIEIPGYPELTDVAAWRPYEDWAGWHEGGRRYCRRDDPEARGGYYTADDIREVVEYARERHIEVIPEIEMPGHSEEVLAVYPHLSCSGEPYAGSEFCVGKEQTFEFLERVLDRVIELFPSEYIHIGGDEAGKESWRNCPDCRARMRREGLKDVDELQSYLVRRIERHLNARGRRLIGWDEILEGGLAPEATVMSWRGVEGGIQAARAGHHAVMSPSSHCYLDFCQDDPSREPLAAAAFLTLERAYSLDPAPDSLGADVVPMILGVQGNLWCEHVATAEHAEHMMWPRLLAVAEVGWSAPERKDYADFHARALDAVRWMQERGYHPFDLKNAVGPRPESREPVDNLATGCTVVCNPTFHPKYPAAGEGSLTDGLRGDWHYGDGRWQGWLSDVELTVDLGVSRPLHRIAADFMQGYHAYIWVPRAVEFSVSDDNEHFTPLATVAARTSEEYRKDCYEQFAWEGEAEGRYVRLKALRNGREGGWIFTDEIVVE